MGGFELSGLTGRIEANFLSHLTHLHRETPGMRVVERPGWVLSDSGLANDSFNTVYVRGAATPPDTLDLREALEHVRGCGRPFAYWAGPSAGVGTTEVLARLGLRPTEEEPGMALDLGGWEPPVGGPPVEVHAVRDEDRLAEYGRILAAIGDPPDENVAEFFRRAGDAILRRGCPMTLLIGCVGGEPVATCEVMTADGVAGVYNVATLRGHQRRGFGTAMVVAALAEAVRRDCSLATLLASTEGRPVYRRLGFRECGVFRVFQGDPTVP